MASTSGRAQWSWPEDLNSRGSHGSADSQTSGSVGTPPGNSQQDETHTGAHAGAQGDRQKHYKPRTCRICLEVVQPTTEIEEPSTRLFAPKVRVRYVSEDPESGRLISPCKCKGSQKYVHEGCLQAWRRAAAPLSNRNYWSCPTCKFQYRLSRLKMGRWLGSRVTRGIMTIAVMIVALFVLGFVADPIINLWVDPVGSITEAIADVLTDVDGLEPTVVNNEAFTLSGHFMKGMLSLGVLGFLKTLLSSPLYWVRWGLGGFGGRRRRGRDRVDDINWYYIVLGIMTFMAATWKLVNHFCERLLEKANDQVVDIQTEGDDEDDDDEIPVADGTQESKKDL